MKPFIYLSSLLIASSFASGQTTPITGNLEVSGYLKAGSASPNINAEFRDNGIFILRGIGGTGNLLTAADSSGSQMLWHPGKYAFRAGRHTLNENNIGKGSVAFGQHTVASGENSWASGWSCAATGKFSQAAGQFSTASGLYAVAFGYDVRAEGARSVAMNQQTKAIGLASSAFGISTQSVAPASFVVGERNVGEINPASGN